VPTYEYTCTKCGHDLEAVQRFSDDPLTECPECGGVLRKVYGAVGIVLKGSGFYKTDSRAAANGAKSKETSGESSGGDSAPAKEKTDTSASSGEAKDKKKKDTKPAAATAS
jgi:putative FmdB family regulatory protein